MNLINSLRDLEDAALIFDALPDEEVYQTLITKTIAFTAAVAIAGNELKEKSAFSVISGEGEPTFDQIEGGFKITFPSILKKSRRLTGDAELQHLIDKYEEPIKNYFWDRDTDYGCARVFWFEFHGFKGDCDNLETKVIIDLLSGYFVPDDTGRYISIYESTVEDKEVKTVLRILTKESFVKELTDETTV